MSTVCLLTANTTAYDSLPGLLDLIGAEFTALGHHVIRFDVTAADFSDRLKQAVERPGKIFALTFSGIGLELRNRDRRLLWEAARIPCFSWYCDHPSYFIRRHRIESPYVIHGYVFPDHALFNRDHLRANGACFPVHIGLPDPACFRPRSGGLRNGRLVFAKSGWDPAALERSWRASLAPALLRLLFDSIDAASAKTCGALPQIIVDVAEQHGIYLACGGPLFNAVLTRVDNYIRATRTTLLASILVDYPVDFFGSGWDYMMPRATRAAFHGPLPFAELCQQLPGYLGAASVNPNVDLSVHDRVFLSIAAGVVPVFDANAFSRRHMPMLRDYSFSYGRDAIESALDALLSRPHDAQATVAEAFSTLQASFSMRGAARYIHDLATSVCAAAELSALPAPPSPTGAPPARIPVAAEDRG
jgi:hypothetical protein